MKANLNPIDIQLIHLVAEGLSTKLIADRLCKAEATIETYRCRLLHKMHVANSAQMIAVAFRIGILNLPVSNEAEDITIDILKDVQGEFTIAPAIAEAEAEMEYFKAHPELNP